MKFIEKNPPRTFSVGFEGQKIEISDCGEVLLQADEMLTFTTENGAEYDVVRKDFGFYATPSTNGRLKNFGLQTVIIRNLHGQFFVLLVEKGKEELFKRYAQSEQFEIVVKMDDDEDLQRVFKNTVFKKSCPICRENSFKKIFTYNAQPDGEIRFEFASKGEYFREILQCDFCQHCISVHQMDMSSLYSAEYVNATYGEAGLLKAFQKIMSLPPERSDNMGRVQRINEFARKFLKNGSKSVLDVGSGLCVFLHRMKGHGWNCTALDPDERAANHAREVAGVDAICGDFFKISPDEKFNAVTFNKVLEHVEDPIAMLKKAADNLLDGGFVYIEVPDAEEAMKEGNGREEFFIDHHHIFSMTSVSMLASKAGFRVVEMERLHEPSTKYTLRAFLAK
ncbi:MAG TPA: methyltransferase domain-containing protein [Patescibacteria group bacterium]|nr:methyltransferase domain-containing protein [Patescibacteria group bacterium]